MLEVHAVYQSKPGEWSVQRCTYNVQDGALLCVLPDITTCFADASFEQTQVAHLSVGANIVLLDWYLAGRVENGERWALARYVRMPKHSSLNSGNHKF
ncbi:hypothetical protein HPB51_017577 [Rhipicephalus microplus]|uniref:Uncharacterized protein n=1 Tax=Rhipicephalus microplus TaxID=6941 RepID=A0A9J6F684_RHIMP|nr:hypothetical protein HPB51_017577 [Rhipicephalus microplus]